MKDYENRTIVPIIVTLIASVIFLLKGDIALNEIISNAFGRDDSILNNYQYVEYWVDDEHEYKHESEYEYPDDYDFVYNAHQYASTISLNNLPEYNGNPYAVINNNVPAFTESEISETSYESYGEHDSLGRCTAAIASLSIDTMPPEGDKRESIGMVKPSGWKTIKYDCVNGKYLYNRCHMIGWQLSNENANEKNLVTGTRYMNLEMLEYENMVAQYIRKTGNHVIYRVTPIFVGSELVCRGLLMEGYSVEDAGEGIKFNVFFYNVQPGVDIDYATGDSLYSGIFLDKSSVAVNSDFI